MKVTVIIVAGAVVLAGCGAHSAVHPAGARATVPAALPSVSRGDAGRLCAGLNALIFTGYSGGAALRTAGQAAYYLPAANRAAEVAASVHLRCPKYVNLLPKRYR